MKLMSKRVGLLAGAAFALTAGASLVSAQFVATIPSTPGSPWGGTDCSCVGGQASKVACFACCSTDVIGVGFGWFNVDPSGILACYQYCGLERRSNPCRTFVSPGTTLPR